MYPPHSQGGYEAVWQAAVERLRAAAHEVVVLTTDYRTPGLEGPGHEAGVHRELRWYWHDDGFPKRSLAQCLALERHNASVFGAYVRELSPDVVTWWAMGGMSLSLVTRAARTGLPAVGVVGDDWMFYGPMVDGWTKRLADRPRLGRLLERITRVPARFEPPADAPWLFVSDAVRTTSLSAHARLRDARIAHSGISGAMFPRAPTRPWEWRLLYVGRIDRRKGIDTAIQALAELPEEARLSVLGTGDDDFALELAALVRTLGVSDRVRFGARPREALHEEYAAADLLLFPVRWEEPWGLVPLEAMSVGTPVIATASGGSSEYLRHEENCLVYRPPDDVQELAGAIRRLATDEPLRKRIREAGFATAAIHSEEAFQRALSEALEGVLAR